MALTDERSVVQTIRDHYDQIFSAEKKVADFILSYPEKAVNANVSEMAKLSGVSDATVVRLCQHIGYKGYYQMRICLSRDIGSQQLDITNLESNNADGNSILPLFQKYAGSILAIGRNLSQETMIECATLISQSKQTHIVAAGNTSSLAQYLGFRLGRIGIRCSYNMIPEYFINHINLAGPEDIVVAISKSGSSKQVVQGLELAKEKGLRAIAVTGHEYSPVSSLADYVLVSSVEGTSFKSYSHLAEMAVLDALVLFVQQIENLAGQNPEKLEIIFSEYKI